MTGPWNPARDQDGAGSRDSKYHADQEDSGFTDHALGANQPPTAGHDQQPQPTAGRFTYPDPGPRGELGNTG